MLGGRDPRPATAHAELLAALFASHVAVTLFGAQQVDSLEWALASRDEIGQAKARASNPRPRRTTEPRSDAGSRNGPRSSKTSMTCVTATEATFQRDLVCGIPRPSGSSNHWRPTCSTRRSSL